MGFGWHSAVDLVTNLVSDLAQGRTFITQAGCLETPEADRRLRRSLRMKCLRAVDVDTARLGEREHNWFNILIRDGTPEMECKFMIMCCACKSLAFVYTFRRALQRRRSPGPCPAAFPGYKPDIDGWDYR